MLAAFSGRLVATFLFGVDPLDPLTFVSVPVVILLTAIAAAAAPRLACQPHQPRRRVSPRRVSRSEAERFADANGRATHAPGYDGQPSRGLTTVAHALVGQRGKLWWTKNVASWKHVAGMAQPARSCVVPTFAPDITV